uniref:Uncharacterized protein n=1 Tax=Leptocylindrus danicus TaxID=163516 RepID=A0A7S2KC80_9STRA
MKVQLDNDSLELAYKSGLRSRNELAIVTIGPFELRTLRHVSIWSSVEQLHILKQRLQMQMLYKLIHTSNLCLKSNSSSSYHPYCFCAVFVGSCNRDSIALLSVIGRVDLHELC